MQPGEPARREHGKQDYFEPKWQLTKMKMKLQMKMMLMMKMNMRLMMNMKMNMHASFFCGLAPLGISRSEA